MSDHANHTAATTAGWIRVQIDRGATGSSATLPRFASEYHKTTTGAVGDGGGNTVARGESNVSQVAADTAALNALNGMRKLRYGAGAVAGTSGRGGAETFDVT